MPITIQYIHCTLPLKVPELSLQLKKTELQKEVWDQCEQSKKINFKKFPQELAMQIYITTYVQWAIDSAN